MCPPKTRFQCIEYRLRSVEREVAGSEAAGWAVGSEAAGWVAVAAAAGWAAVGWEAAGSAAVAPAAVGWAAADLRRENARARAVRRSSTHARKKQRGYWFKMARLSSVMRFGP